MPVTVPGAVDGVGDGCSPVRHDGLRRAVRRRDPLCRRRLSRSMRGWRCGLGRARRGLAVERGACAPLSRRRQRAARRQRVPLPALAATLRTIASGGVEGLLRGRDSGRDRGDCQGGRRLPGRGGSRRGARPTGSSRSARATAAHDILEIPPNGQGITALILLRLLERLAPARSRPTGRAPCICEIEAGRLAYAVRDHLVADPAAMTRRPRQLLSDAYIDGARRPHRSGDRRNDDLALPEMPRSDTVYLTVVDRDRRAVSFINSTYSGFGSKRGDAGVRHRAAEPRRLLLARRGPSQRDRAAASGRCTPSFRPWRLRDGRPSMAFGVMGGDYQPMGHVHVLTNMVDTAWTRRKRSTSRASSGARTACWTPKAALPGDASAASKRWATRCAMRAARPMAAAQVIVIDRENGFLVGGSDPRKDGCAIGW